MRERDLEIFDSLEVAKNIADFIIEKTTGKNGLVGKKIDISTGTFISNESNVDEFGDYVQNIAYLGMLSKDQRYIDWSKEQLLLGAKYCQSPSGLFSSVDINSKPKAGNWHLFIPNETDTLIGLVSMSILTKDHEILGITEKLVKGVFEYALSKEGHICIITTPKLIKVPLAVPMTAGNYKEELIRLYHFTKNKEYLEKAELLSDPWKNSNFFKKYNLYRREGIGTAGRLLNFFQNLRKYKGLVQLEKDNTHINFGLLSLYIHTEEEELLNIIKKWLDSVHSKMYRSGIYYNYWNVTTKTAHTATLAANHSMVEFLIDAYVELRQEKYLEMAKRCVDSWMKAMDPSGLIPYIYGGNEAWLDPQIDFAVNLLKLFQLTGEERYWNVSQKILMGILKYHKAEFGYAQKLDILNKTPTSKFLETKYLGLMLKPFLFISEIEDRKNIFKDRILREMMRDR